MIMEYQRAKQAADYLLKQLKPHCEKIEIAGSIRRLKQTGIKDVELVAIPKTEKSGLFGNSETRSDGFIKAVRYLIETKIINWFQFFIHDKFTLQISKFISLVYQIRVSPYVEEMAHLVFFLSG